MAKQSQIDKAIAALEDEIRVLQTAISVLRAQQAVRVAKPRKPRAAVAEHAS